MSCDRLVQMSCRNDKLMGVEKGSHLVICRGQIHFGRQHATELAVYNLKAILIKRTDECALLLSCVLIRAHEGDSALYDEIPKKLPAFEAVLRMVRGKLEERVRSILKALSEAGLGIGQVEFEPEVFKGTVAKGLEHVTSRMDGPAGELGNGLAWWKHALDSISA